MEEQQIELTEIRFTLFTSAGQFKFELKLELGEGQSMAERMMSWLQEIKTKPQIVQLKEPTGNFTHLDSACIVGFKVENGR